MPQKCSICLHPKRRSIERAMLNPKRSVRNIAAHFEVSATALQRHKAHIKTAVATARRNGAVKDGKTAYEQFTDMVALAEREFRAAKGMGRVAWFREWRGMLELAFKLGLAAKQAEIDHGYQDVSPACAALIDRLVARKVEGGSQ